MGNKSSLEDDSSRVFKNRNSIKFVAENEANPVFLRGVKLNDKSSPPVPVHQRSTQVRHIRQVLFEKTMKNADRCSEKVVSSAWPLYDEMSSFKSDLSLFQKAEKVGQDQDII